VLKWKLWLARVLLLLWYDMLKFVSHRNKIVETRLLEKTGGKSDIKLQLVFDAPKLLTSFLSICRTQNTRFSLPSEQLLFFSVKDCVKFSVWDLSLSNFELPCFLGQSSLQVFSSRSLVLLSSSLNRRQIVRILIQCLSNE
jgi:hypothetical protein